MSDLRDPLENLTLIAVERVGRRLSAWDHAREVVVVHATGVVHRWLCRSETHWRHGPPRCAASEPETGPLSACSGRGSDPAEVAAGLSPVLGKARVFAFEPNAVTLWLTTLYSFVDQPMPCRVLPLDELHRELLPGLERIGVVCSAGHYAALLHPEAPHLVTEVTRAIETLRQIAYRVEIGRMVAQAL